jgi:L-malate glycosyltransferase
MKHKLHFHTHAASFSGAENMLSLFLQSERLASLFSISFSYRFSRKYYSGLIDRVQQYKENYYALRFLHLHSHNQLPRWIPILPKRILFVTINWLILYPLMIYEVVTIARLLFRISPDILHINNAGYPAASSSRAAAIAGWLCGVPKIVMVVNNMAVRYDRLSRWPDYPLDRVIARCVDVFITGSKAAGDRLQAVLKLPDNKLKSIHNGIALRNPTSSVETTRDRLIGKCSEVVIFGVVALLVPRKGHQVLLSAILKLVNDNKLTGKKIKIIIEGHGPLQQNLVDFVTNNKLTPWVTFVGDEVNIVDFMAALDVIILPSVRDEDFPNVILEAMALGKPIIASRLAGIPEQVIDGKSGILTEPRNVTQLSKAVLKLLNDDVLRSSMGKTALFQYNNYFTDRISIDNYCELYKKLLRKNNDRYERDS